MSDEAPISTEVQGHVFLIGLNRSDKMNAFNVRMLRELAEAFTEYEENRELRCAVIFAHGANFTAGLDLAEVGPAFAAGEPLFPRDAVDPLNLAGRRRTKPVIATAHGWCLTVGVELMLACDIRIAADNTKFGQIEIKRGIMPFGGATLRLPLIAGWGNAMRYLLTGDEFDAAEALRIGMIQEVVRHGRHLERAIELAETVAKQAPLAVQATLRSARVAHEKGVVAAGLQLDHEAKQLMKTEDAMEGMMSFMQRREAQFKGR